MKNTIIPIVTILAIALNVQAGSLKMPAGNNITRNAGTTIPISFTASGWPSGQTCQVWLLNAQTWQSYQLEVDVPIFNGANLINIEIPWDWTLTGKYLVKITAPGTQATSTWFLTVRAAIKYPYFLTQWWPGAITAVTWVLPPLGEYVSLTLVSEATGQDFAILNDLENPDVLTGRYDFVVPDVDPGQYRVYLRLYQTGMDWDDWFGAYVSYSEEVAETRSERIVIQ